jgi:transposase-like protein
MGTGGGSIRWHLDEMMVSIAGRQMYMWRAVDSEGEVLEILVQPLRDKTAALRLLRKLLRRQGFVPTVIVTDKLRSYGAPLREIGFSGLRRTKDVRFQINQVGSAFCLRPCGRLQHIQCTTTFYQASDASTVRSA